MRNSVLRTAALAACLLWGATAARAAEPAIHWAKTWTTAKTEAAGARKLIMIDFYTDWCGWCKKLDADTYSDAKVVEATKQVVTVKLDAEKAGKAVAQKYNVHAYPTILFIDPNGNGKDQPDLVGSIVGYSAPGAFLDSFNTVLQDFKDFPIYKKRLAADPHDVEALGRMVCIYHGRQDDKRAISLLNEATAVDPENSKGYLTRAYNAIGDVYQSANDFDKAIPYFDKAAKTGTKASDIAYARTSIAVCYLSQQKFEPAIAQLRLVIDNPDVSKSDRDQAQQMLDQVKAVQAKGK